MALHVDLTSLFGSGSDARLTRTAFADALPRAAAVREAHLNHRPEWRGLGTREEFLAECRKRAKEVLARLERDEEGLSRRILAEHAAHAPEPAVVQVSLFDLIQEKDPELVAEIRAMDLDAMPPIEAWKTLLRVRSALD